MMVMKQNGVVPQLHMIENALTTILGGETAALGMVKVVCQNTKVDIYDNFLVVTLFDYN